MQDAIAWRNHIDISKGLFCPVNEVETVLVSTILNSPILIECVGVKASTLNGQRMIDDQLGRHHGVHLCGVSAFFCNCIA